MRQEHRFCAEVFRRLHSHLDHKRPVYLCLDGQAAKRGVTQGFLLDAVVPDFIFQFVGGDRPFFMEAKVVEDGRVKFCGDGQPTAWGSQGFSQHKPVLWIATDDDMTRFFFWQHTAFVPLLDRGPNAKGHLRIPAKDQVLTFDSLDALVNEILSFARSNGFYPTVGAVL